MRKILATRDVVSWSCVGWLLAESEVTAAGLTDLSSHLTVTLEFGTLAEWPVGSSSSCFDRSVGFSVLTEPKEEVQSPHSSSSVRGL